MANQGKRALAAEWESFSKAAVPKDAPERQRQATRDAFYAGAQSVFTLLIEGLSEGPESEPEDEQLMENINAELKAFGEELTARCLAHAAAIRARRGS
jgi:hypothetical protein